MASLITTLFSPLLIGTVVKLLASSARKYPNLTDIIATLTLVIVGGVLIGMSIIIALEYHHILTGAP